MVECTIIGVYTISTKALFSLVVKIHKFNISIIKDFLRITGFHLLGNQGSKNGNSNSAYY